MISSGMHLRISGSSGNQDRSAEAEVKYLIGVAQRQYLLVHASGKQQRLQLPQGIKFGGADFPPRNVVEACPAAGRD